MRQTVKRIHQGGCYHLPYFNTMARTVFDLLTLVSYNGKKSKTETSLKKT